MKQEIQYIFAVDGGGTKTDFVIADQNGKQLAKLKIGPSNLYSRSYREIKKDWNQGLKKLVKKANMPARTKFSAAGIGIAGLDNKATKRLAKKLAKEVLAFRAPLDKKLLVVNDTVIGFWSGCGDVCTYGIGIVGGTGSNCYGVNKKRKEYWVSGLGHILADEGGGYEIGMHALKAAVKSADKRGPKTVLEKMILQHFKEKDVRDLIPHIYYKPFGKTEVAEIALLVEEAAIKGDKVAVKIAEEAADELVLMVKTVAEQLKMQKEAFNLVMIGGVLQRDPIVTKQFKKEVKKICPNASLIIPTEKPVMGALRMALATLTKR